MSRRSVLLAFGALLVGTSVGLLAGLRSPALGDTTSGDADLAADVRAALTTDRGFTSLSVARVRAGQVTFAGLGEVDGVAPGADTPYELGSITKTFTAALLADAVGRGEVRLDDPVSTYLGELTGTPAGGSTLRALATHTAGLPAFPTSSTAAVVWRDVGNANPYPGSVAAMLAATRSTALEEPGTYRYSNLGVALLGHALARAAKTPDWPTLLRLRVLDPLGMTSTRVVEQPGQVPDGAARPRHDNGWPAPFWTGPAFAPAGSSTITTAADLATWARALLDGSAPGAAALEPVTDIPGERIGLVWHVRDVGGRSITWHNGGTGGTRTILALDRARGQAVLILANSTRDADAAGLVLAATNPGAPVPAVDRPAVGWPALLGWNVVALLLLVSAVRRWRPGLGRPQVEGVLSAATGLLLLLVHGPWKLVPPALWAGLALALLVLGLTAGNAEPRHRGRVVRGRQSAVPRGGADRGRGPVSDTAARSRPPVASLLSTALVLALALWTL